MNIEKEKLLKETYDTFLNLILYDSPLDRMREYIADDVMGYGTTLDEKILDIMRLRKLVIDQREQGAGAEINFDVKPVFRRVTSNQEAAIFVDEIKISMIIDGAKNELPLRFSSVFYYLDGKWMLVHLHGSVAVETEGDTWHLNEWQRKNEELQKLVEEKTSELLNKNRELEIETALEKVRSSALTMKKPSDMLEVCQIISEQLESLKVKEIRNVQTAIFYETKGIYLNYEFYFKHNKKIITEVDFKTHDLQNLFANQMLNGAEELFKHTLQGKELKDWYDYQKTTNQFADFYLEKAESLNYYWYSLGPVALGMSTYSPLNEEEINLFKRFRNVFELAYRRFIDIEQAVAQAREAQIQLALERVRARTMAMQRSEELPETTFLLFQQLKELGEIAEQISIGIIKEEEGVVEISATIHGNQLPQTRRIRYNDEPFVMQKFAAAWKENLKSFVIEITGVELLEYNNWRNKFLGEEIYQNTYDEKWIVNIAYFSKGALIFSSKSTISQETFLLLERFARVFDLTYTRFLDLKNAEAQAREAKIETALERVRARTMAMQKSEELSETASVLFQQFKELDKTPKMITIGIMKEDEGVIEFWVTDWSGGGAKVNQKFNASIDEPVLLNKLYTDWKNGSKSTAVELVGKDLQDWVNYRSTLSGIPDDNDYSNLHGLVIAAFFSKGMLSLSNYESHTHETVQLLERFAGVFDLTYTRFLDLKNAEAQAREAQIETALERVRSRTMAMRNSNELAETAVVIFKQLIGLGIAPNRLYIGIIEAEGDNIEFWITDEDGTKVSKHFTGDKKKSVTISKMYDAWKQQKKSITIDVHGKELEDYFRYLNEELKVPFRMGLSQKRRVQSIAYFSKGFIGIGSPETQPEETINFLERFAGVFNLTFTRFLDLKNAEAQNKIIQAENERKTKELEEARQLQLAMLPKELPQLSNLEIAVHMKTATEVGGDYYDFQVGSDGTLTAVIGDATGHGMKAGTMVTITKSLFNSLASGENILDTYSRISQVIRDMKFRQLSMCLQMLKIKGSQLSISSAAMPPALIYRMNNQSIEEIFIKGMPLGAMNNFPYSLEKRKLEKGDTILMLSDGLPELKNNNNDVYGYDRTKTEFLSVAEKEPEKIIEHLKNSATKWSNGKEPEDDVTFVVIKIK
ncbi:MAG: hypothetical protein D4R68_00425 [Ignavibacteriales bacterium]|nr:MAG: hypothetical protein D4R68_00425 [Ignavibacteriales bacterium]